MNTTNTARVMDLGNNESATIGLVPQADGTFLALTFTESKTFKSERGAVAWLARRRTAPNGSRI